MALRFNTDNRKVNVRGHNPLKFKIGNVPAFLGTGDNAKHSIAVIVLISCFIIGAAISMVVVLNYWIFRDHENKVPDFVGDLRVIWEIVTPIITLVLGYEFGKNEK